MNTLNIAPWMCAAIVVLLVLGIPVTISILREEARKRWEREKAPKWWGNPVRPAALGQSLTVAGQPSPVILVEERDPRIVRTSRAIAECDRAGKRTRVDRAAQHVRKIQKARGVA